MLRFLVYLVIAIGLFYVATQVPIGKRTLVGHVRAIWHTEEVQELKDGVKEKAKPAVDRIERGVKAGYHAATDGSDVANDAGLEPAEAHR
jgi:hypothetical protein